MAQEKITIAIMGMDQHENGAVAVTRPLVRWQFRGGLREADRKAFLFTNVTDSKGRKYDIPVVIGGSVITADDAAAMRKAGIAAVFPAGARDADIIDGIRDISHRAAHARD